ncbi:MAG TPA: hypothetical protein VFH66_15445 [Mycobacteriales bacterium]|nr:hypothetical protein [Mycobacteriales bacterium]
MRMAAVRRQALVALALVVAVVIQNARSGSSDTAWQAVALGAGFLALLCLTPAAFTRTPGMYRAGAIVVAVLLTIAAVQGVIVGSFYALPAAILAWLTTAPIRKAPVE